ncbi:hypothetical protein GDO81_027836 [Engystomops pustulosus]|uniref:Uncharacterized protein n=1 Tax=Engystomops pustulosus TaxID=76066 RepID=A0AAV6ZF71_ENGPU|nr:hypothetical protein GDO81_027836 [Engystomops pustulosus]
MRNGRDCASGLPLYADTDSLPPRITSHCICQFPCFLKRYILHIGCLVPLNMKFIVKVVTFQRHPPKTPSLTVRDPQWHLPPLRNKCVEFAGETYLKSHSTR